MKFSVGRPINWGLMQKYICSMNCAVREGMGQGNVCNCAGWCKSAAFCACKSAGWEDSPITSKQVLQKAFFFVEANTMLFADVPVGRHPHAYLQSVPGRSSTSLASCSPTPLHPSPTHGGGTNLRGCHSFRSCCGSWWCWNPVTGCVAIY